MTSFHPREVLEIPMMTQLTLVLPSSQLLLCDVVGVVGVVMLILLNGVDPPCFWIVVEQDYKPAAVEDPAKARQIALAIFEQYDSP